MRTNMSSKHLAIIVLATVIVFLLPLSSCSHKQKKETPEETPIEEEMGEAGCDFDKGEDLFCNFLSADQFPQDAFFADMVEAYNSFVLLNGLYSIRDKWRRYECSEEAVASLKYADISMIKSKDFQKKFSACLALILRLSCPGATVFFRTSRLFRQFALSTTFRQSLRLRFNT